MAGEQHQNFLSGTITDSPLLVGATTANSSNFANLNEVTSTADGMLIVLDPDASAGAPELVRVTAHTTSATSVTIARGQEGSTAREHAASTVWRHVVSAAELNAFTAFLADGAVGTDNLADNAITEAKIADNAIDLSVIAQYTQFTLSGSAAVNDAEISWTQEDADPDDWGTVATTDLTCPASGVYALAVRVNGDTALDAVSVRQDGVIVWSAVETDTSSHIFNGGSVMNIDSGDVISVLCSTTGSSTLSAARIVIVPLWKL